MKFDTNPVRGTVDYMPAEMDVRTYAEQVILKTYKQNGFLQIKTPVLESLNLLTSGDSGDNQKLMFKTVKRGEKLDLSKPNLTENDIVEEGLRYDLTVPLVRFYINNREKLPTPFKSIQIDEAFRAERPQRGRIRQFTQCDIDILGDSTPMAEIELLYAYMCSYKALGFEKLTFKLNDRRALNQMIVHSGFELEKVSDICISIDKFDKIGFDGVTKELVANGYPEKNVLALIEKFKALKVMDDNNKKLQTLKTFGVSDDVIASLSQIIETVMTFRFEGYKVEYDACVIRGQGYYTGTVVEVFDDDFGRAIGGGGRYDKMIEKFAGISIPAVGASIGLYSVVMLMNERGFKVPTQKLALIYDKNSDFSDVLKAKVLLMEKGFCVSVFAFPKNFNNFADKIKKNGYDRIVKINDLNKIIEI